MLTLSQEALEIAISYLGVHDNRPTSKNTGPDIDQFLSSVNLTPGYPWCASFMYFCFREAAMKMGVKNPCPKTGSAVQLYLRAEPICRVSNPTIGSLYVLDDAPLSKWLGATDIPVGTGHTGIVSSLTDDGLSVDQEISGNTDKGGSRVGGAVWKHQGEPEVTHGGMLLGFLNLDLASK